MPKFISLPPLPLDIDDLDIPEGSDFDPFWEWFVTQEAELYIKLTKPKPPVKSIEKSLKAQLDKIHEGFFCDTFIDVSGKAVIVFRNDEVVKNMIFAVELVIHAPQLPNWQFHAFIPPVEVDSLCITNGKLTFNSEQMQFYLRHMPETPAENHLVVIYPPYNMADGPQISEGMKTLLINLIGEDMFHLNVDELYIRRDVLPEEKDAVTVRPLSELFEALEEREAELEAMAEDVLADGFIDDPDNHQFSTVEMKSPIGTIQMTINETLAEWPYKFCYPFIMSVNIGYVPATKSGLPDKQTIKDIEEIFDEIQSLLRLEDNCLKVLQIIGGGVGSVFFALRSNLLPSMMTHFLIEEHPLGPLMSYELNHDKYWRKVPLPE
jgi:hypothetical protein